MTSSRRIRATISLLAISIALAPAPALGQKPPKRERNVIAREELVQAADKFSDLYQAIKSLRPHFLTVNNRGVRTSGIGEGGMSGRQAGTGGSNALNAVPVVYIDGRKSGDPSILKSLLTRDVGEVRYLGANDAGMEYGLGHEGGAIVVKTALEPKPPS
jgi:hypothetical protein